MVFTATSGILVSGNTGSQLFFGLYNSGGVAPLNTLNNSGISTATGSTAATGGAQMWQGYVSRMALSGANNTIATRPQQTGAGTTSANQELGISGATGAFNNPAGAQVGSALVSTLALTQGAQYTIDYRITLSAANTLTIASSLYSGVGTGGTILNSQSATTSGTTYLTSTFDALGFGAYNKTVSADPVLDVSSVVITDSIQPVPEPTTFALGFMGVAALLLGRRSRPQ